MIGGMRTLLLDGAEGLPDKERAAAIAHLVEALAEIDLLILQTRPTTPALALARVRYVEGAPWADVVSVLRSGEADCRSLAAWRMAELRAAGEPARVHVVLYPGGGMHVVVETNGVLEDPTEGLRRR